MLVGFYCDRGCMYSSVETPNKAYAREGGTGTTRYYRCRRGTYIVSSAGSHMVGCAFRCLQFIPMWCKEQMLRSVFLVLRKAFLLHFFDVHRQPGTVIDIFSSRTGELCVKNSAPGSPWHSCTAYGCLEMYFVLQ